ncbi:putative taxoid 14-beta-hydroxylase [Helianthus annuus]|nr:putative taxoid 14-beta-hydroxylase [Helianthus annuus]
MPFPYEDNLPTLYKVPGVHKVFSRTTLTFLAMVIMILLLLLILVTTYFLFHHKKYNSQLPPGSLGPPVIGQSLSLLKALKADRIEKWFQERITTHGPVWKASLFGYPTVVLHGPSANKFIYTCDGNLLSNTQPPSLSRIFGCRSRFRDRNRDFMFMFKDGRDKRDDNKQTLY